MICCVGIWLPFHAPGIKTCQSTATRIDNGRPMASFWARDGFDSCTSVTGSRLCYRPDPSRGILRPILKQRPAVIPVQPTEHNWNVLYSTSDYVQYNHTWFAALMPGYGRSPFSPAQLLRYKAAELLFVEPHGCRAPPVIQSGSVFPLE